LLVAGVLTNREGKCAKGACNLSTSAMAAVPSMLRIEQLMQRFAFYIDSEQNKACNFHVALRPLAKGVLFAPGSTDVTGESEKSRNRSVGDKTSKPQKGR
jgi:hypothetical protein